MFGNMHRVAMVALLFGSAILLFSCKPKQVETEEVVDAVKTEESRDLTLIMSENGRKSYIFKTPLLEGYMLGRDPYREFRKGIKIVMFEKDSLSSESATLTANYAIFYEDRKLWEAKGDVVAVNKDGRRLYTSQLFWNQTTHRIYSNVDSKIVSADEVYNCEGFESDEKMKDWTYRKLKGVTYVNDTEFGDTSSSKEEKPAESAAKPAEPAEPKKSQPLKPVQRPAQRTAPSPKRVETHKLMDNAGAEKMSLDAPEKR